MGMLGSKSILQTWYGLFSILRGIYYLTARREIYFLCNDIEK